MSRYKIKSYKNLYSKLKLNCIFINKLVNFISKNGKKHKSKILVYKSIYNLSKKTNIHPIELLKKVINNLKPFVEIKSKRIGGTVYQIPIEIKPNRAIFLAIKWLIQSAIKRTDVKSMRNKLYLEL